MAANVACARVEQKVVFSLFRHYDCIAIVFGESKEPSAFGGRIRDLDDPLFGCLVLIDLERLNLTLTVGMVRPIDLSEGVLGLK